MERRDQVSIMVPADLRFSNSVRNFVADLLRIINVKELWINRLVLVVDEVFMNAVKYGSKDRTDSVWLTVNFFVDAIQFLIEDTGRGEGTKDPEQLQKIILQSKEDLSLAKTSGRGLSMIVANWTNSFSVEKSEKGGMKVIVRKKMDNIIETPRELQKVSIESMPEVGVVTFAQKLDVHDSDVEKDMVRRVEEMDKTLFIFDLANMNYINSVVIGLLAKLYNIVMKKKGKAVIINLSDTIEDTLKLVGLTDIMPVVLDLEEAKKVLYAP